MRQATARPQVRCFFDSSTGSLQYVFHDPSTMKGAIIDPVWNFAPESATLSTRGCEEIIDYVRRAGVAIEWILDTHPHADHFSAAAILSERLGAPRGIGARVVEMQRRWREIYNLGDALPCDGRQWDRLFVDGDVFMIGDIPVRVMASPGHTLASISYVAGDAAFVHDTLMAPAAGTSRADFPGGDADQLWTSIRAILDLPEETRLFVGHDYPEGEAEPRPVATVAEHRRANIHVRDGVTREDFIALRKARDATLPLPKNMLAALQVNLRGGRLPEPEPDGFSYLKIPVGKF